jgi:hypothetical protein
MTHGVRYTCVRLLADHHHDLGLLARPLAIFVDDPSVFSDLVINVAFVIAFVFVFLIVL